MGNLAVMLHGRVTLQTSGGILMGGDLSTWSRPYKLAMLEQQACSENRGSQDSAKVLSLPKESFPFAVRNNRQECCCWWVFTDLRTKEYYKILFQNQIVPAQKTFQAAGHPRSSALEAYRLCLQGLAWRKQKEKGSLAGHDVYHPLQYH